MRKRHEGIIKLRLPAIRQRNIAARRQLIDCVGAAATESIHALELALLDGKPQKLSDFAGKVLLVVNVASKCGFTPQYAGLEALYEKYSDRGFAVLGFPCNQFFHQEPGSAEAIQQFCDQKYGVTFPLFAKLDVKGANQSPLYAILTQAPDDAGNAGNVKWNFEKFVVGGDGKVARRFRSKVTPEDPKLVGAIEELL